jgi:glutamine synthetase
MSSLDNGPRIKLGVFDIDGLLRGKYISREKFESASKGGLGFCDVIFGWDLADELYDNVKYTGWHTGYPDAHAVVDLATRRHIPWEPNTDFYLLDLVNADGSLLPLAPRNVLKRVIGQAHQAGYEPYFAAEFEFWLFEETPRTVRDKGYRQLTSLTPGMFGYSIVRASSQTPLVHDLLDQLRAFDCELEGLHTETGPGVYEAAIAVDKALAAADKAALFKTAVKEIAQRHGLMATFMAKWNAALPGSSGHLHQSLWDSSRNLFATDPRLMNAYIAGLAHHLPAMMALYCPTVNSYKRTVPGTWAPVNATWGVDTRTAAIRALPGGPKSSRVELRITGADINPYLAIAASLASGLDGIANAMEPAAPVKNAYSANAPALPLNLRDASRALDSSEFAHKALGTEFVSHYCATREWEWRQFSKSVTSWELERYFESI